MCALRQLLARAEDVRERRVDGREEAEDQRPRYHAVGKGHLQHLGVESDEDVDDGIHLCVYIYIYIYIY